MGDHAESSQILEDAPAMDRYPPSGLSVLVIGGGIAGLSFAIEAYRKGHDVKIIERRPDFHDYGDLIAIQASALHTPSKWPGFMEACQKTAFPTTGYTYMYDGTLIGNHGFPLALTRAAFHHILHAYAEKLKIGIQFSTVVTDYVESDDSAAVVLEDGTKITADVVVAADGVGSKSWGLVSGFKEKAISSGFAVFRATYPVERALENPLIAEEFKNVDCRVGLYVGPEAHLVIAKSPRDMVFMLTHKDDGTAEEAWTKETPVEDILPYIDGWAPFISEAIKAAPGRKAVDFKLMWRDPRENWTSPKARVIQIGDAAHTFLPSSASGATMAMEDAFTLATCLQLSGKHNAPLGIKVHNHLRAERAICAQKMGFKTRQFYHDPELSAKEENKDRVLSFVGSWLTGHDPEQYAQDNYRDCAECIVSGKPFKNTNAVPGYTYEPWTVQELLAYSDRGEIIVDDGDWA